MSYINRSCYNNSTAIKFSIDSIPKPYESVVQLSITTSNDPLNSIHLDLEQAIEFFKQVTTDLESYKISTHSTSTHK